MKYTSITLQKVYNLGNYESVRMEMSVTIDLEDDDELQDAVALLNSNLTDALEVTVRKHQELRAYQEEQKKNALPW